MAAFLATVVFLANCSSDSAEPANSASSLRVRLLTGQQYSNMIAQIFGVDISDSVAAPLPPLTRTDGLLASGAAFVGVTSDQIQQIQQAAATVAAKVVDETHRDFLIPCKPVSSSEADSACAARFLRVAGRLLYRRPLHETKVAELAAVADAAADQAADFYAGLAIALEAMLIGPEVVFIVDVAEPDPERPGQQRLDAYSLASRLSFFLWNAAPDDELLLAAESGELQTSEGLRRVVDRMLTSARLEDGVRAFFDDMMAFDEFGSLAKDPVVYPMVTGATLADAREQTLRTVVDHVITRNQDYRDLFTTRSTFMSMNLAAVYGIPASNGWIAYDFPRDSIRSGLLTQVSFLAAHSHAVRSSPTLRGKALRELFLCQKVPAPPPNVDFSLLEDAGDLKTARERLKIHSTNPSCAGCHLITDPMGLALENFDGAGRYRATENGVELDISGELDGTLYDDVDGLATALRNHPKLPYCLVNRMYAYGTGGPVSLRYDREILAYFLQRFSGHGYKVPDLLRDIALSQAFSRVRAAPVADTVETQPRQIALSQP
ncbi:MAG: DUF1592 domain-containing protein [Gammaproteobacteria bacterium]|nr:DUF1592 domain-containing protein [Gammaproteobacteria bacterium]